MYMEDKLITFKGTLARTICDKENFKMYAININKEKYPDLTLSRYGNVTICGDLFDLQYDTEYNICVERDCSKYGYRVKNITFKKPTTAEDIFCFLNEILTSRQAETLFEHYPDIIDRVKENRLDDIDLNKLKGIKEKTFAKIVKKITKNYCLADLVAEFQGYITLSVIKKLYNKYSSVEKIRSELQKDAYKCLSSIGGIGFKKADAILLQIEKVSIENIANGKPPIIDFKEDLKTSSQRCKACLIHLLEDNQNNGHTQMNLADLRSQCMATVKECSDRFTEVIQDSVFYYNKEHMEVSLRRTYATEYQVCQTLIEALKNNIVWDVDIEKYRIANGCNLTDEQLSTLDKINNNNIAILNGSAGCVDCDTEYFNGTEWKRIADYQEGEKVLQYNKDGSTSLAYPYNYIRKPAEYLWHFETKYGLDQCLCGDHNCYYITSKGNLYSKTFREIKENQEDKGFFGKFITTFDYEGQGIDLSDDEIRLMIAVFADGSYHNRNCSDDVYKRARFHLKKDRKKQRLEQLLNKMKLEYKKIASTANGYDDYYVVTPFRCKHFPKEWYQCNKHQMEVIFDEIMYWDGYFNKKNNYSTTNKNDADFVQFVLASLGYRATIHVNDRTGRDYLTNDKIYVRKSVEYTVSYTKRKLAGMCYDTRPNHTKTEIKEYKTLDGYKYCFTVPSHMLVLRRNNKIFITGNCGKSATAQSVINMLKDLKKTYKLFAPTGRASKVLAEYTNEDAMTIHRGLGYVFGEGFIYNKKNKLETDVVIVDEFSMVDIFLMKSLIDAIDFTKTKLLMIGDANQLPSVGCGNVLHDLIYANIVPTSTLTKVFRYSEGGLMKVATDVRLCEQYLTKDMKGKMTSFGNNKDYTFIDVPDDKITMNIVALYKKLLSLGKTINDIQVLTSKNIGDCGAIMLNNAIQKVANPNYDSQSCMTIGRDETQVTYYVGDLVIQKANNYKALMADENGDEIYESWDVNQEDPCTAFIANGEIGVIKDIYQSYVILDFDGTLIKYFKDDMNSIGLGYAISVFKSQGGSANTIILATPKSHTFMLNSNLVYVGLTRMKEKCFHLGNLYTVNTAIQKKANLTRSTFMQRLLIDMYNGIEVDLPYPKGIKIDIDDIDNLIDFPF